MIPTKCDFANGTELGFCCMLCFSGDKEKKNADNHTLLQVCDICKQS